MLTRESILSRTTWHAVRSSGAGGQNVNKVNSAVAAEVDLVALGLSPEEISRVRKLFVRNLSEEGRLFVKAREHRAQEMNRKCALTRIVRMLEKALRPVRIRRSTRPPREAIEMRLHNKAMTAEKKKFRSAATEEIE